MVRTARQQAADLHDTLRHYIEAAEGEEYAPSIMADPPTFKRLVKLEGKTERQWVPVFEELATELSSRVDWYLYQRAVARKQAADEVTPAIEAAITYLADQKKVLVQLAFNMFEEGTTIGVDAGVNIYALPVVYESVTTKINRQAIRYSNRLVTGINDTTASLLRSSLRTSLELGEDVNAATLRVMETINNPVRARMIARTEPVNAYGRGILLFGKETGAKRKVIDAVLDNRTSHICRELSNKYGTESTAQDIDEPYTWGAQGGGSKQEPGFHVNCRTGHYLLYT